MMNSPSSSLDGVRPVVKSTGGVPGHIALPDIMTLNKADELTLRGWGKMIDPPLKVRDDGVVGRVSTKPSSLITVRDMDALQPLEQGGKWDVNAALTQDRRASIRRMFYADQLHPDKTIITATEVERRIELAQQILGPTMGRLEYEYLNPLISRCFKMLMRSGDASRTASVRRGVFEKGKRGDRCGIRRTVSQGAERRRTSSNQSLNDDGSPTSSTQP